MYDFFKMKLFNLLADTSQEVTNDEMQNAYEEFVEYITTISNSEDYANIFRMLNLTRIEITPLQTMCRYGQGEKCA